MCSYITYESKLHWKRLIEISSEKIHEIVDDIESFSPTVPIEGNTADVVFSVLRNEDEGLFINVHLTIDKKKALGCATIEEVGSILDEVVFGRLKDLLFTMNLAYPGHIFVYESTLFRDGVPIGVVSYSNDISGWAFKDCKWLSFEHLTIKQCWDWITTRTNFLSYISRTPIDRALHALSYESVANEDMYIFYALLGLEAVYNNGSNREDSIFAQLKRKIQAVVGELPTSAIKKISSMYVRRSQLVHGAANIFKCWPSEVYSLSEYDKTEDEREYMIVATGILLATIQKFIKADANTLVENLSLKLDTVLDPSSVS